MQYTRTLTLNLDPSAKPQIVDVKQHDAGSNVFTVTIKNGSSAVDVTGKNVYFRCTKPSGAGCRYACNVSSSGVITLTLTGDATEELGLAIADLAIEESNTILSTEVFWLNVKKSGLA